MPKTYTLNRCRPMHEGEWSDSKTYLELSVVYDPVSGDSYTSRIPVPAGTPLTDVTYWVKSSDFNAQLVEKGNFYDTVADMRADNSLTEGMTAVTKGYYAPNDGGGAVYTIVNGVYIDNGFHQQIGTSELYAELLIFDVVNVKQLGARGDGLTNDTLIFEDAFNTMDDYETLFIPSGKYVINNQLNVAIDGLKIKGQGAELIASTGVTGTEHYLLSISGTLGTAYAVIEDIIEHDTTIILETTEHGIVEGDYIKISTDENYFVVTNRDFKKGEIVRVASVDGATLTLERNGTELSYLSSATLTVQKINTLNNIYIEGVTFTGLGTDEGQAGLAIAFCLNALVENCYFRDFESAFSYSGAIESKICKCWFKDCYHAGTGYGIVIGASSLNTIISENHFEKCRHSITTGGFDGVCMSTMVCNNSANDCTDAALHNHGNSRYMSFVNNTVTNSLLGIAVCAPNNFIVGNNIINCYKAGIYGVEAGGINAYVVDNNIDGYGIDFFNGITLQINATEHELSRNVNINNNRVANSANGAGIVLEGVHVSVQVNNNHLSNIGSAGILINKAEQLSIKNNLLRNSQRSTYFAIIANSVTGNDLSGQSNYGTEVAITSNHITNFGKGISVTDFGTLHLGENIIYTNPADMYLLTNISKRIGTVKGSMTFSGDGTTTAFNIPHSIGAIPDSVFVTPKNTESSASYYVTKNATNITINFAVAPANGVDNISFDWCAMKY